MQDGDDGSPLFFYGFDTPPLLTIPTYSPQSACAGLLSLAPGSHDALAGAPVVQPALKYEPRSRAALLARTIHLRCLPPTLSQRELGDLLHSCGTLRRVRICANTGGASIEAHKWLYGFVEFDSPEAAQRLVALKGTELSGGPGKPALRLKCSVAKQPIVDVAPDDAADGEGRPCSFGRGPGAGARLLDVVHIPSKPVDAGAGSAPLQSRKKTSKASRKAALVEDTPVIDVAACGCGCKEDPSVRCCSCCKCHETRPKRASSGCCGTVTTAPVLSTASTPPHGSRTAPASSTAAVAGLAELAPGLAALLPSTSSALCPEDAAGSVGARVAPGASAGVADDGDLGAGSLLDGVQAVEQGRRLLLRGLSEARASLGGPPALRGQAVGSLQALLATLDRAAPLTGGPLSCTLGDPDAVVPQRATLLRLQGNLALALLHLLRRSLAEALPFFDAIVAIVGSLPRDSLVDSVEVDAVKGGAPGRIANNPPSKRPTLEKDGNREEYSTRGTSSSIAGARMASSALALGPDIDGESSDCVAALRARDVRFHSTLLNTLLCVGLALEEVQPRVARGVFAQVAERSQYVLGMRSETLMGFLEAGLSEAAANGRRLSDAIPTLSGALAGGSSLGITSSGASAGPPVRDVTEFAKAYFSAVPGEGADLSDGETWWASEGVPPMHIVPLFPC